MQVCLNCVSAGVWGSPVANLTSVLCYNYLHLGSEIVQLGEIHGEIITSCGQGECLISLTCALLLNFCLDLFYKWLHIKCSSAFKEMSAQLFTQKNLWSIVYGSDDRKNFHRMQLWSYTLKSVQGDYNCTKALPLNPCLAYLRVVAPENVKVTPNARGAPNINY